MDSKQRKQAMKQRGLIIASLPDQARKLLEDRDALALKLREYRNVTRKGLRDLEIRAKDQDAKLQETVNKEMARIKAHEADVDARLSAGKKKLQEDWDELNKARMGFKVATDQFEKTKEFAESVGLLNEVLLALEVGEDPSQIAHGLRQKFNLLIPQW